MEWGNVVDVSSFMLVEATGDSEVDSDSAMEGASHGNDTAEDDAESCSCDLYDSTRVSEVNDCGVRVCDGCDDNVEEEEEEENSTPIFRDVGVYDDCDDDQDEGEVSIDQYRTREQTGRLPRVAGGDQKLNTYADSAKERLNEKEKNRLFWESCLAS